MEAVKASGEVHETISEGRAFGEAVLGVPQGTPFRYRLSVFAMGGCEMYHMKRSDFHELQDTCPMMMRRMFILLQPLRKVHTWCKISDEHHANAFTRRSVQQPSLRISSLFTYLGGERMFVPSFRHPSTPVLYVAPPGSC